MTLTACTVFYNRLDLLEIWFNQLKDVVDKFVVLEGNISHVGKPRELVYNPDLFKEFNVTYVPVTDIPSFDKVRFDIVERYLNDSVVKYLPDRNHDDLILFSHADEILNTETVKNIKEALLGEIKVNPYTEAVVHFHLLQCRYWLNCFLSKQEGYSDRGPFMTTYEVLKGVNVWRMKHIYTGLPNVHVQNGGWHYSWCGPKEYILDKLYNTVEQKYNKPEMFNFEYIQKVMDEGGDILQEARAMTENKWIGTVFVNPEIKENSEILFPKYVLKNLERFKYMMKIQEKYNVG